ncbi:MAG: bifunctional (p)ppGpp synthetase/guanosine-3',5'-bis(diphosphate) 3'-pyrophosphohydrolase [Chloroflexota bacterium]|nr:bifunctional (p)ppGpp synthetase/guanosine-3',5'-bis(diphosphate) 3'-pyrophosphohydrolase [Chloroflexota bacterium]
MNKQRHLKISDILDHLPPNRRGDDARDLIRRAYAVAEQAHAEQTRKSGNPYIQHPLAVAFLLAEIGMDPDTIAAGLLHDVVEDTDIDLKKLRQEFGPHVEILVDGVTKLEQIEEQIEQEQIDRLGQKSERLREQESESLRKMFIAMAEDVRVVVVKLADRLHNMRTLDPLPPERRKAFSRETLEIFAPLASRLGVWQWKWQLEDLSFRYLNPSTYAEIVSLIEERRLEREASVQSHAQVLQQRLAAEGVEAEITGRPKHIYSIYRKMQRKGVPFRQVYDVRAIRVITQTVPDCYRILGVVHGLWKPIPGEFDDYIATPKDNLYQSLHTAVIGEDGKTLEVQIRTWEMHHTAEYGVAAHWRYKEGGKRDQAFEAKVAWLRSLIEWRKEAIDADEFIDAMKTDIFRDRVYTFTPKGRLIDLPVGATPIDFAYKIHTEIGHHCRGARVNGKLVSLGYQLESGDQVDILTARRGGPSRDWLNPTLGYTKTSRARNKIRQWFRRQDREQNVAQGREIIERELKRLGLGHLGHEAVAQLFNYEKLDDFHAAVGFGDINSQQVASKIAETRPQVDDESLSLAPPLPLPTIEGIQVQGTGGLLTRLARCCNPLPGDDIIGYVTRGRGVTIHRCDCPNILCLRDTERLIEVNWGTRLQTIPVTIRITAYDRTKLLSEISSIISAEDINMSAVNMPSHRDQQKNIVTLYITLEIRHIAQLSHVLTKIEWLPNVIEAQRHTG